MENKNKIVFGILFFVISIFTINPNTNYCLAVLTSRGPGVVDSTSPSHYAYGENIGWIDFNPTGGNVVIADEGLTGYAYAENAGWIHLDYDGTAGAVNTTSTDWGVVNDAQGHLSGYAYSENLGWINFDPTGTGSIQVTISDTGVFSGYAYGENIGWISFNCSNTNSCANNAGYDYKVLTNWGPMYEVSNPPPQFVRVPTTVTAQQRSQIINFVNLQLNQVKAYFPNLTGNLNNQDEKIAILKNLISALSSLVMLVVK